MSDSPLFVVAATIGIIGLSAFFVAVEFALMAAKKYRLEDAAATSRSARAALRSANELTLMLAGSQLGITVCTLALGGLTKPAVHHWLAPVFESVGLTAVAADAVAFILALFIVTFLHLVIGEMAPKSWAIAHPEFSATLLAVPMRVFMVPTRPILRALNSAANGLVRAVGVPPVDTLATGQNPEDLRHLVEHSVNVGALDLSYSAQISSALQMHQIPVRDLIPHEQQMTRVPGDASAADVRLATRRSGHLRVLIGESDENVGVVHVRDTLALPDDAPAMRVARPAFALDEQTTVQSALATMRRTRNHLALVREGERVVGLITLPDVLRRLLPPPATRA